MTLPPNEQPGAALADLDVDAAATSPDGVTEALAEALNAPALGEVGAYVIDPADGAVLLDQAGDEPMQPGSAMKLYTAAAAALALEPGATITTSVVAGDEPGEIVLVAGGDPTLRSGKTSTFNPGSASIAQLAKQLKAAGVDEVTRITVDNSVFSGPVTGPGWGSEDAPSTYAAEVYPVMADGGRSDPSDDASMRYADPDLHAAELLAKALGSPDATVDRGAAPTGAQELAAVESAPIEQLIEQMLAASDNTLAECLGRLIAIATGHEPTFAGAVDGIDETLSPLGIDLDGHEAYDASGLSGANLTTAASIASLLQAAAELTDPRLDVVLSGLAVGGYSGTLAARFGSGAAQDAAGQVRGKTGTLTGVSSLSGTVLTADGQVLVYSFISNGGGATQSARAALDAAAAELAGCGCK